MKMRFGQVDENKDEDDSIEDKNKFKKQKLPYQIYSILTHLLYTLRMLGVVNYLGKRIANFKSFVGRLCRNEV